jgi:hypothetical protein
MRKLLASGYAAPRFLMGALCAGAVGLSACGTGNEPFSTLGDSLQTPTLALPLTANTVTQNSTFLVFGQYGATQADKSVSDGFDMSVTTQLITAPERTIVAPAAGLVVAVDAGIDAGTSMVTIQHSPRLTTRLNRVANVTALKPGDYVAAGAPLGTALANSLNFVRMTVIYDGAIVCPYGYLSQEARVQANTYLRSVNLVTTLPPCLL